MNSPTTPLRTKAATDPLTVKQRAYVEARANGKGVTTAMREAGYKVSGVYGSAPAYIENPHVNHELARLQAQNRERNQVTRDEVIKGFREAIKDAKLLADPMAQISGWREIGKMCGFYEPERHEIVLTGDAAQVIEQIQGIATDRLLELAGPDVIDADFELVLEDDDSD